MKSLKCLIAALVLLAAGSAHAALQWQIPGGIGTVQLPFEATEAVAGYDAILKQAVAGASLPVLTLGRTKHEGQPDYRWVDGQVGAVAAWPSETTAVEPYLALGHDLIQDVPGLSQFKSIHLNGFGRYSPNQGGFGAGGTFSWAFGNGN